MSEQTAHLVGSCNAICVEVAPWLDGRVLCNVVQGHLPSQRAGFVLPPWPRLLVLAVRKQTDSDWMH
eukprot:366192-Chlamydomonas_euryale.AAC.12